MTDTDQLLEQIRKVVREENEPITKQLTDQGKKLDTLELKVTTIEMKVEAIHEQNRKDHTEIMEKLTESNEINGEQLKAQDKRLHTVEDILQINNN